METFADLGDGTGAIDGLLGGIDFPTVLGSQVGYELVCNRTTNGFSRAYQVNMRRLPVEARGRTGNRYTSELRPGQNIPEGVESGSWGQSRLQRALYIVGARRS